MCYAPATMWAMRNLKLFLTLQVAGLAALATAKLASAQVRVTPDQGAQKWTSRLSAASTEITNGVNRVTVAPGQLAAAKFDKWLAGVQASAQKWRSRVASVPLETWRAATIAGIPRIATAAQAKQGKYQAFASEFYPFLEAGMAKVHALPDSDINARINRAVQMMQYNATFKRSGSGQ